MLPGVPPKTMLMDRTVFKVSPKAYRQFLARLDALPKPNKRLLKTPDTCPVGMSVPLSSPEPLGDDHLTDGFDSGEPVLDDWLRRRARPNQASGASRI
jgi:hypothetical protein